MSPNLAIQEIHDTLPDKRPDPDWQAMYRKLKLMFFEQVEVTVEVTRQRDMLATRCAEQAKQIAAMHAPFAQPETTIADAIAAMQRQGVR